MGNLYSEETVDKLIAQLKELEKQNQVLQSELASQKEQIKLQIIVNNHVEELNTTLRTRLAAAEKLLDGDSVFFERIGKNLLHRLTITQGCVERVWQIKAFLTPTASEQEALVACKSPLSLDQQRCGGWMLAKKPEPVGEMVTVLKDDIIWALTTCAPTHFSDGRPVPNYNRLAAVAGLEQVGEWKPKAVTGKEEK